MTKTLYETVRRISHVELIGLENNNNNTIKKSPSSLNYLKRETGIDVPDSTPAGYEPENSLRRVSTTAQPSQLQRSGGLRRRSALDRPHSVAKNPTQEKDNKPDDSSTYEPENSLRRTRKSSDQSNPAQGKMKNRRNGLRLDNPILIAAQEPMPEVQNISALRRSNPLDSSDTNSSKEGSPITPRAINRKIFLNSSSIPENEEMSDDCMSATASPRHRRKISLSKFSTDHILQTVIEPTMSPQLSKPRSNLLRSSPSSPCLTNSPTATRKVRRSSQTTPVDIQAATNSIKARRSSLTPLSPISLSNSPTVTRKVRRSSQTTPVDIQAATNSIKARRSSLTPLSPISLSNSSSTASRGKNSTPVKGVPDTPVKARKQIYCEHMNATRYWNWYILNAGYSWQNFNTNSHYGY